MASAIERLSPLIGAWEMRVDLPGAENTSGRMTMEPMLGGAFLAQRSEAPDPVPDSFCVIAPDTESDAFTQHYFDSRGVVRVYAMGFENGLWTLSRDRADFSELPFKQRYEGTLDESGERIEGRCLRTDDDGEWITDFELVYSRIG